MADSGFPPTRSHAGRRRIATRSLADAAGIDCAIARRGGWGVSARRTTAPTVDPESTI
jgi:hypothetical protein